MEQLVLVMWSFVYSIAYVVSSLLSLHPELLNVNVR